LINELINEEKNKESCVVKRKYDFPLDARLQRMMKEIHKLYDNDIFVYDEEENLTPNDVIKHYSAMSTNKKISLALMRRRKRRRKFREKFKLIREKMKNQGVLDENEKRFLNVSKKKRKRKKEDHPAMKKYC
jgi:DNA modification methylase